MPMYKGAEWATGEGKEGTKNNITEKWEAYQSNIKRNVGKI